MSAEKAIVLEQQPQITVAQRVTTALDNLATLIKIVERVKGDMLHEGLDYGVIPGTGDKPTLLLPGMEKLTRALNVRPEYVDTSRIEDFDKPLFHYEFECRLVDVDTNRVVPGGIGRGSCNSYEQSFGWRWVTEDRIPANLDKATLEQRNGAMFEYDFAVEKAETTGKYGKPAEYWQRFKDAIASGEAVKEKRKAASNKEYDGWLIGGVEYRIPNPYVFDSVNAIMKRAKKRALGDAIKGAAAVSEYFTVDLEDMAYGDVIEGTVSEVSESKTEQKPAQNGSGFNFDALNAAIKENLVSSKSEYEEALSKIGISPSLSEHEILPKLRVWCHGGDPTEVNMQPGLIPEPEDNGESLVELMTVTYDGESKPPYTFMGYVSGTGIKVTVGAWSDDEFVEAGHVADGAWKESTVEGMHRLDRIKCRVKEVKKGKHIYYNLVKGSVKPAASEDASKEDIPF